MLILAVVFLFGAIMGSFLNVCIYRMPREESVVWPRSHCPSCRKRIPGYDNVPLLSYLLLGGKCRACKAPISAVYPIVELLTGFFSVVLYLSFGLSYEYFVYMFFICGLIIATFVDIAHRIIPDEVSVGGMILGLVLSTIKGVGTNPLSFDHRPLISSAVGVVAGGGIIYVTGLIFDLVYFRMLKRPPIQGETESMGGGDVKLLAMIGAFLGWKAAILTFFLAPFFGAVIGVANLLIKKDHTIPYGPFLSLAAVISLFWQGRILGFFFPPLR